MIKFKKKSIIIIKTKNTKTALMTIIMKLKILKYLIKSC